jgi:NADPH:quinone reductase-like Zn-dependent oxidoreductase
LEMHGADEVIVGDTDAAEQVRALTGGTMDVALELVGPPTLGDTAASLHAGGVVCLTGYLARDWDVDPAAVSEGRVWRPPPVRSSPGRAVDRPCSDWWKAWRQAATEPA